MTKRLRFIGNSEGVLATGDHTGPVEPGTEIFATEEAAERLLESGLWEDMDAPAVQEDQEVTEAALDETPADEAAEAASVPEAEAQDVKPRKGTK